jgi:hypothetical protein
MSFGSNQITRGNPLYRGQGNGGFETADPRSAAKRGQSIPYDVNGAPSGATVADADYGDIVVTGTGTSWMIDASVVTTFARTILDDVDATAVRATLGLGYFATGTDASNLTGNLGVVRMNGGTGASSLTFWRGDGTWTSPTASLADADYGDITVAGGVWTIDPGVVSLAKMANVAAGTVFYRKTAGAGAPEVQTLATLKTDLAFTKSDVGLGSVDNTADAAKDVLSATKLFTARNINGVAFDGSANITINAVDSTARVPATRAISTTAPLAGGGDLSADRTLSITAATGAAAGSMSAADKAKLDASSTDAVVQAPYRPLLDSSGSHIAAKVAGTYGMGQGDPLAVTGTGILYPLNVIYIDAADYPAIGSLAAKLRVRCIIECNDVAPTGNFTVGLHAVTRPGTSGGAGLCIYTMAAALAGSTATSTTPAADSQNIITGSDFAVPATGFYVIGVVTTATIAASAHMHFSAQLQMRYA